MDPLDKSRAGEGEGAMSTGVAIVGFLLCFLAGSAVMWGYDSHRLRTPTVRADGLAGSAGAAWADREAPIPVTSDDPVWGKRDDLEGYAKELGLDVERLRVALDNHTHKPEMDADDKAGAELGLRGTPAFLINGYFVDGAEPYAKFKKLIDRALAEAK